MAWMTQLMDPTTPAPGQDWLDVREFFRALGSKS
jgi:hypothetical protein